jgi:hypothetical protein
VVGARESAQQRATESASLLRVRTKFVHRKRNHAFHSELRHATFLFSCSLNLA